MSHIKQSFLFFLCVVFLPFSGLLAASPPEFQWVSSKFESLFQAMSEVDTGMLVVPHPDLDKEEANQQNPEPVWKPRVKNEEEEKAFKADFVKTMIKTHDYVCFGKDPAKNEFFYGILQLDASEQGAVCYFKNRDGQEYKSDGESDTLLVRSTVAKWESLLMKSGKAAPGDQIMFDSVDFYTKLLPEGKGSLLKSGDEKFLGTHMVLKKHKMPGVHRKEKDKDTVEDVRGGYSEFKPIEETASSHSVKFEIVIEAESMDLHKDPARNPYYVVDHSARWVVAEKVWCTDNRYPDWNIVKSYREPFPEGFIDRHEVYNRYMVLPFRATEGDAKRLGLTLTDMEYLVSHAYADFYVVIRLNESRSSIGAWDPNLAFALGNKLIKDDSAEKRTMDIKEESLKKMVSSHGTVHRNKAFVLVTEAKLGFNPNEQGREQEIINYVQKELMTTGEDIEKQAQLAGKEVRVTKLDDKSRSYYQRIGRKKVSDDDGAARP